MFLDYIFQIMNSLSWLKCRRRAGPQMPVQTHIVRNSFIPIPFSFTRTLTGCISHIFHNSRNWVGESFCASNELLQNPESGFFRNSFDASVEKHDCKTDCGTQYVLASPSSMSHRRRRCMSSCSPNAQTAPPAGYSGKLRLSRPVTPRTVDTTPGRISIMPSHVSFDRSRGGRVGTLMPLPSRRRQTFHFSVDLYTIAARLSSHCGCL
ncbi:hypothetical protein EDB92DRAFT_1270661 [Lactarius akahatsu]|uniref:Uncharacterized protein n=1 Tax=Lactarius akahatsu TaxID=416441 RepID=A0AAD4LA84_9AGAM|nr:hypothetical protein EDB92DRAFT_1270661 [Lactarius akahatsu]